MMITIGENKYPIRTPKDLDARLLGSTGCTAAEHLAMLGSQPQPLARALHPFLEVDGASPITVQVLAAEIAAADVGAVLDQVRALYTKADAAESGDGE